MASELTTLQVCRKIADAVLEAHERAGPVPRHCATPDADDPPTQAVIRVLHETGSWISRWDSELPADTAEVKPPAEDEPTLF